MSPFEGLITNTADAAKSSLASVKKVEGVLQDGQMIPGFKNEAGETDIRVKVVLADAIILEMADGVPEPELKDGTYSVFYRYGKQGTVKSSNKSFYTKGFLASAQELAKQRGKSTGTVIDLIGTRVTMEFKTLLLFKSPNDATGELEEHNGSGFVFVPDGAGNAVNIEDYVQKLIVGQKPAQAVRLLMSDNRTKYDAKWKDAISAGTIGELVKVELKDGIYCAKG